MTWTPRNFGQPGTILGTDVPAQLGKTCRWPKARWAEMLPKWHLGWAVWRGVVHTSPLPEFTALSLPRMQTEKWRRFIFSWAGPAVMVRIPEQACKCVCHLFLLKPARDHLDDVTLFKASQTTKNAESYYFIFLFFNVTLKSSNIQIFLSLIHFTLSKVRYFNFEMKKIIPLKWQHFWKMGFIFVMGNWLPIYPPKNSSSPELQEDSSQLWLTCGAHAERAQNNKHC